MMKHRLFVMTHNLQWYDLTAINGFVSLKNMQGKFSPPPPPSSTLQKSPICKVCSLQPESYFTDFLLQTLQTYMHTVWKPISKSNQTIFFYTRAYKRSPFLKHFNQTFFQRTKAEKTCSCVLNCMIVVTCYCGK